MLLSALAWSEPVTGQPWKLDPWIVWKAGAAGEALFLPQISLPVSPIWSAEPRDLASLPLDPRDRQRLERQFAQAFLEPQLHQKPKILESGIGFVCYVGEPTWDVEGLWDVLASALYLRGEPGEATLAQAWEVLRWRRMGQERAGPNRLDGPVRLN
jgi:hypothetical protein